MAVIDNSRPDVIERRYERVTTEDSSGWAVALLILLALIVLGLLFWWRGTSVTPAASTPSTNINVSAPGNTGSTPAQSSQDSSVPGNTGSAAGTGSAGPTGTGSAAPAPSAAPVTPAASHY